MHQNDIQLHDPSSRQSALKAIQPTRESARQHRTTLLAILQEEMKFRERDGEDEETEEQEGEIAYYEHLYWCSFLLYLAGDPRDSLLIWEAKHINFDTSIGMNGQCLVGAGVEATRRFLAENQELKVLEYVDRMQKCGDLDDLDYFERARARYFYGEAIDEAAAGREQPSS